MAVDCWAECQLRTATARYHNEDIDLDDLIAELDYGAHIAHLVVKTSRWRTVADLLRVGGVGYMGHDRDALGTSATDARDGFHRWVHDQVELWRDTGTTGLIDEYAAELYSLSEAVSW